MAGKTNPFNVLKVAKVKKGADVTRTCGSTGFYSGTAPENGVSLSIYGSRSIYLSEKNLAALLKLAKKGGEKAVLELEEYSEDTETP